MSTQTPLFCQYVKCRKEIDQKQRGRKDNKFCCSNHRNLQYRLDGINARFENQKLIALLLSKGIEIPA